MRRLLLLMPLLLGAGPPDAQTRLLDAKRVAAEASARADALTQAAARERDAAARARTQEAALAQRVAASAARVEAAEARVVLVAESESAAETRLAAVQALYQHDMEGTPLPQLLHEFHQHRLGATIEGVEYAEAEVDFFDDLVKGARVRQPEIDAAIAAKLSAGWKLERLDKPMKALLRVGTYELLARADVPTGAVITEYVDVAHAFYDRREAGFVNGLLDAVAKDVRAG